MVYHGQSKRALHLCFAFVVSQGEIPRHDASSEAWLKKKGHPSEIRLLISINNHEKPLLTTINLLISNHYNNYRGVPKVWVPQVIIQVISYY